MLCQYFRWHKPRRCVTEVSEEKGDVCVCSYTLTHTHTQSGLAYNRPYLKC